MSIYHKGYEDIKVRLISWDGDDLAKKVYEFGRFSNDFNEVLPVTYDGTNPDCKKLIDKIIAGTTLPKFALMGTRIQFSIEGISRICLAQLTRDNAIFASQGGGVFPLTMDFNIPLSLYQHTDIMEKVMKAQNLLEEAYIMACERDVPALEARYIGLHCQTISLTASYTVADFVRSCFSRTSSNFCDECNYVYRLMYEQLMYKLSQVTNCDSKRLWSWLLVEEKCINDGYYTRERLYNSDFTMFNVPTYRPEQPAINDWRKSCWKMELERMYKNVKGYITDKEVTHIRAWRNKTDDELYSSFDPNSPDAARNAIKTTSYYKEHRL